MKNYIIGLCIFIVGCTDTDISLDVYNDVFQENGLTIIYPKFSKIDLVCGTMPNDSSVILVAEAAYTGKKLDKFEHSNIAGNHVANGVGYNGYDCPNNTGTFVYYNNQWKFCNDSSELDSAVLYNGAAFSQELIVKNGEIQPTVRRNLDFSIYRALCEYDNKLCIIETQGITTFGKFKKKLKEIDVDNAIYLDMGRGWNHSWYRTSKGVVELHPKTHDYCTNWITFYK